MISANRSSGTRAVLLLAAALAGCGSNDGGNLGGGPDPAALSAVVSQPSGNGQSGPAGQDLPNPLRIVVLRGADPAAGAVVTWSATGVGASMTPSSSTTGADGISTSVWHLGTSVGTQSAQAAVSGADGSPVRFTATATGNTGGGGGGGGPSPVEIQLRSDGGDRFDPASVTIPVGTTVTWRWVTGFHNVTPSGSPTFTGSGAPVAAPSTFSQTFSSPGTYLYYCVVHGTPTSGMRGTIVVQ
jgi:plastocyanin